MSRLHVSTGQLMLLLQLPPPTAASQLPLQLSLPPRLPLQLLLKLALQLRPLRLIQPLVPPTGPGQVICVVTQPPATRTPGQLHKGLHLRPQSPNTARYSSARESSVLVEAARPRTHAWTLCDVSHELKAVHREREQQGRHTSALLLETPPGEQAHALIAST
jgi:hypothetical protein